MAAPHGNGLRFGGFIPGWRMAMDDRDGELMDNTPPHRSYLRQRRGHIYLSVSDNGRGFDPSRLTKDGGFGLLSICERVKLLGGRMKIRSANGQGSIFLLAVPDTEPQSIR